MELEGIADKNLLDKYGAGALLPAIRSENTDVLQILLADDADVNIIWTMIRIWTRLGWYTLDCSDVLFTDLD